MTASLSKAASAIRSSKGLCCNFRRAAEGACDSCMNQVLNPSIDATKACGGATRRAGG